MNNQGDAANALVRHLHDAIERVREDVEKVEFWADAVTGFTQPVPGYDDKDVKIWLPPEQATALMPTENKKKKTQSNGSTRG